MKKIAIVVQRYGMEVNGGAEGHARMLATRLATKYKIEVITTTVLNHKGWKNHYPTGKHVLDGILVNRFPAREFNKKKYKKYRRKVLKKEVYHKLLRRIGIFNYLDKKYKLFEPSEKDGNLWLIHQGPYSPELVDYLKNNQSKYDCFIFFTYLFYPTVAGMKEVGAKSIFIPTAHDGPILYARPYKDIFALPKFIMYNTAAEKELIGKNFSNLTRNHDIAGIGFDFPVSLNGSKTFSGLDFDYFLYLGRIEPGKGCVEMVKWFDRFSRENRNVKLVLSGKNTQNLKSNNPNIIFTGFVDEDMKNRILNGSKALIMPSNYESLSIVTLEAMANGKIIIANERCKVLKDHIDNSHAGFYYNSYDEFATILERVLKMTGSEYSQYSSAGQLYVGENYSWDKILAKFDHALSVIARKDINEK